MALSQNLKPTILISSISCNSSPNTSFPLSLKTQTDLSFFSTIPSSIHNLQRPLPILSRRVFLPSVSGIWDALTGGGGNNPRQAVLKIRRGMSLFREGDVLGSLAEFDKAIELDSRQKAYLWQRGLSLYYLDRFEEGAKQFRLDVAQNPNDTEESIWCFLCEAQLYGVDEARKRFLELVTAFSNGSENEYFYASLYAGLYHESQKKLDAAKFHIVAACKSLYGQRSDDYMAALSKVHCLCRNWSID
ncbi:uncharacterized protein LOC105647468 isoform X2 [Jatropha curcas]|uniref:uncharacterized protein LOC105647468 isoform X2 n=1 Tax=Jatropha curcas TaxID=180498 RepID=UPI0005FBB2FD|nr:uncharacterized protein LOC105647468 isoform X2 [Jatropha curcas]